MPPPPELWLLTTVNNKRKDPIVMINDFLKSKNNLNKKVTN